MSRILFITRNFPPLTGGMERLALNTYRQLGSQHDCDLVAPRGCKEFVSASSRVAECRLKPLPVFMLSALLKAFSLTFGTKYDAVIAGSGLTAPIAVLVGRLRGLRSITFVHGLDLVVESRLYRWLFLPFIRRSDVVIANSRNTARLAEQAGIPADNIALLHPGADIPEPGEAEPLFRTHFGLQDRFVLLSVGRLIPRKGLATFIRKTLPAVVREHPRSALVIIGTEPGNALNRADSVLEDIRAAIAEQQLQDHVVLAGHAEESLLQAAYRESDCLVFPLQYTRGDVEGFGMVAVEAAAAGLPVIAFAEGGVTDAIGNGESGRLVTPGDYQAFAKQVIDWIDNPEDVPSADSCRRFAGRFHWDSFGDRLRSIVEAAVSGRPVNRE